MEWFERLTSRVFSGMSRKEVKTPLSFFFRIVLAVMLVTLFGIYLIQPAQRVMVFLVGISVLMFLFLGVFLFAWLRPKNLVYGETAHRAESKFAFGTEDREMTASEVASLEGSPNPKALTGGLES